MPTVHAVLRIDHHSAEVLQFDAEHVKSERVVAHSHATRQHGSAVRTEHEFYGEVADSLAGVREVLVAGPGTAAAQFKSYCEKHRPQVAACIVGVETVDHPTQPQLLALARRYFLGHDRMSGSPTPS